MIKKNHFSLLEENRLQEKKMRENEIRVTPNYVLNPVPFKVEYIV